jgi:hypothetical protein
MHYLSLIDAFFTPFVQDFVGIGLGFFLHIPFPHHSFIPLSQYCYVAPSTTKED